MDYFDDKKQNEFESDFGFMAPHKTKAECKNPVFADKHLHRIAIMKKEHLGSKGDRDQGGLPGWLSKFVCTGCGKAYRVRPFSNQPGIDGYFHPDKTETTKTV